MTKLLALAIVAAMFVACSGGSATLDQDGDAPPGPAVDANGVWKLRSGHSPSGDIAIARHSPVTMEVIGDKIRGSAGCNSYGAGISIEGDHFGTGGLVLTEIGCPQNAAEAETRFVEAIEEANTIARDGKTLTLTGPETELVFRLVPEVDTKPLTGTVWILDTLVDGKTVSSTVASADTARLLLNDDGTFEGTTGCRSFTGTWEVSGDVVGVSRMVFDGACKTAAEQDAHVAAVIASGFRAERKQDRLTLTSENDNDDRGLVYHSR